MGSFINEKRDFFFSPLSWIAHKIRRNDAGEEADVNVAKNIRNPRLFRLVFPSFRPISMGK